MEETIVDNEVYELIKATATKLEGLAAYNKYEHNRTLRGVARPKGGDVPPTLRGASRMSHQQAAVRVRAGGCPPV